MHSNQNETFRQLGKFAIVGVSNTIIDFGIYVLLTRLIALFSTYIYLANTISFIAAATWSYFANKNWTFKSQSQVTVSEAVRFYSVTGSGFFINTGILFLLVQIGGVYDIFAKIVATVVVIAWNFLLNKFWVFKK